MLKKILCAAALAMTVTMGAKGADYGLPANIQDGNILHCFDWSCAQIQEELDNIAKAGFGAVQLSPVQGNCNSNAEWFYAYMPYDFALKGSGVGTKAQLTSLCAAAHQRGIKVIVDVVANHVNQASGYHDTWWDSNGRVRWNGGINYGDRNSITHGQLGDYGDVNSEDAQVQARAKAFIEDLKSCGVDGIRWDAAKHIGLPSEGCNFWSTVTSVPGLWHYGEILDSPGGDGNALMKEYTKYMSVTDNGYCDGVRNAVRGGGVPSSYAGWAASTIADNKVVYWAESHDDYSNEWRASTDIPQDVIDRTWAIVACRNGASSLYFSRPFANTRNTIKMGVKGSTHFTSKEIAAINKLHNTAVGHADYFTGSNGVVSVTRKDVGAAIIKGNGQAGNVSITNGGSYCPAGTYTDLVDGGTFTVTASTISGRVGSTGIAVLIKDGSTPDPNPNPNPNPDPDPTPGSMYILGNLKGAAGWGTTPGTGVAMTMSGTTYTASSVEFAAAAGETKCYFNITDYVGATWDALNEGANRYGAATEGEAVTLGKTSKVVAYLNGVDASGCLSWTVAPGKYDIKFDKSAMTLLVTNAGDNPTPNPDPTPDPTGDHYVYFDGTSFSQPQVWAWNDADNCTTAGKWGGDNMVKKNNMWYWEVPAGKSLPTQIIIHEGDNKIGGGDLKYVDKATYHQDGTYTAGGNPDPNPTPDPTAVTIAGDYNLAYSGSHTHVYYWGATSPIKWEDAPAMASATGSDGKTYKVYKVPAGMTNVIFKTGGSQTGDLTYTGEYIMDNNGATSTKVVFSNNPVPVKPTVAISPNGGTVKGTANITVTISGNPTSITSDFNGKSVTLTNGSNTILVSSYLNDGQTGTLTVKAVNEAGTTNVEATFTRSDAVVPVPVPVGDNLITDYYKVNPNGQFGSNRTVNMSFSNQKANNALSHWTENDLIAQGVARDVAQAMKGNHERPVVDSYAIYAAYDNTNLYLGVQFVYTIWDLYGEGKQPGESKPYNMDGRLMLAFDLDPDKSFDGYINGTKAIWNDENAPGAKFENGVDAVWIGSTKPGVGTPGFFIPTPDGHASYDAAYCKPSTVEYGYADGLASCISHVWGQKEFNFEPEVLQTNNGFVDLRDQIADNAHTMYEFRIPLSLLGVTEDYIRTNGIGVQYLDVYGSSPVGGTPYDPAFFDNVKNDYSKDPSSSQEKEDEDILTYMPARIGNGSASVGDIIVEPADDDAPVVYYNLQGMRVDNPANGIYIMRQGSKATKVLVR